MGKNEDTATEIMYYLGKISKHKCPHDTRSNTAFWVILVNARYTRVRKDPTLVIHCEGLLRINLYTINVKYRKCADMYHLIF